MAPKKKQEKMNLGEFLTNQSLGSWADEMETQPIPAVPAPYSSRGDRDGGERRAFTQPAWEQARSGGGMGGMGGMGGRAGSYDRPQYAVREQLPFPDKPPYTAHLGNLAYDVSNSDVEDLFKECQVTSVRIVEDKNDHKPKGFGYVEFSTPEGLKKALTFSETNFMGRNVKISIAEPPKDRAESTRDFSDWSRKGPLPDLPQNQRQPSNRGGFDRSFSRGNFDNMSDAGSERGGAPRRQGFFEGDDKVRDFSDWSRKGPLSPAPNNGPPGGRDGGRLREAGPSQERRQTPAWGEGRSDAGSRPPRREFEARPPPVERAPTAAEQDTQWRARMKPDASPAPTPDVSTPSSPQQQAPKERPKLNLTKRTVSTGDPEAASNSATDSKASPFGAAKPIDSAAREREVEEKRQLAIRQKKEADDKAREDKTAKEAAARQARADRADQGQAQEDTRVTSPTSETAPGKARRASRQQNGNAKQSPKENGDTPTSAKPGFSILRRDTDGENDEAVAEDETRGEENANGSILEHKDVPAQDIAVGTPIGAVEGALQNTEAGASELKEEDGWATVPSKTKNNRRGPGRTMAS